MSDEASGLNQDRKNLLKRAFSMAQGTLTSRILGLFRDIAMGSLFDRAVTDAWVAAFRLPNFFRRLLGEGLVAGAFIPLFIQAQKEDPSGVRAQRLMNSVATSLAALLGSLCLIAIIFMDPLLRLLLGAGAFSAEKWFWTVRSGQIMFLFVLFVTWASFWGALLQARGRFGWVGLAPALLNIAMLIFTFLPSGTPFSFPGEALAWGVFVGGVLQAGLLWGVARVEGFKFQCQFKGSSLDLGRFYQRLGAAMVGVGVFQFSSLIHLYFASGLEEGAISAIYWADRLMELPLSLVSVSLGASLLPTLSLSAEKNPRQFWQLSMETFSLSLFWAVPAGLGLFLFAEPLVQMLFMRGEFQVDDLLRTSTVLKIQSLSLVAMAMNRVLLPVFYSRHINRLPFWISVGGLGLQVLLSKILLSHFAHSSLQTLMVAGCVSHFAVSALLMLGLGRDFLWAQAGLRAGQIFLSALTLMGPYWVYREYLKKLEPGGLPIFLALSILFSVFLFVLVASGLRSPEASRIRQLFQLWLDRLRQKG